MLPGNLQYWQPCKWFDEYKNVRKGSIAYNINEPIHFSGPSPGDNSTIAIEEENKEQPKISQPDHPQVTDQEDPKGVAQQRTSETEKEETKEPRLTGESVTIAASVDAPPRVEQQPIQTVQQSEDVIQATLHAFQSILAQQLEEKLREQREQI